MKRTASLLFFATLIAANPALALRVTNLDNVQHTITYDAAGSHEEYSIPPGETISLAGQTDGRLSLKTAHTKRAGSTLNADGLLSGVVGVARNQNIPAYGLDDYVIWEGGELQIQRRMKDHGRN